MTNASLALRPLCIGCDVLTSARFAPLLALDIKNPRLTITLSPPMPGKTGSHVFEVLAALAGPSMTSKVARGAIITDILVQKVLQLAHITPIMQLQLSDVNSNTEMATYDAEPQPLSNDKQFTVHNTLVGFNNPLRLVCVPHQHFLNTLLTPMPLAVALSAVGAIFLFSLLIIVWRSWKQRKMTEEHGKELGKTLEETQKAKEALAKALQQRRNFTAFICHELRSPLQSIMAMAEFGKDQIRRSPVLKSMRTLAATPSFPMTTIAELPEFQDQREAPVSVSRMRSPPAEGKGTPLGEAPSLHESFSTILTAAKQMLVIVSDVLQMNQLEAGKLRLENVAIDLRALLQTLYMQYRISATQKGLLLSVDVAENVPATVYGDPTRLAQVLQNLLGNAIKFTSVGSVTVKCSVVLPARCAAESPQLPELPWEETMVEQMSVQSHADIVCIAIEVIDTGVGISEEAISRLFSPYEQAALATARQHGGSGRLPSDWLLSCALQVWASALSNKSSTRCADA